MSLSETGTPGASWPQPTFRFEVDFGNALKNVCFQQISGMDEEQQIIEYRGHTTPHVPKETIPGIVKFGNVTMKRGMFVNDNTFWDWYNQIKMNVIKKSTVLIKLLNEKESVTMQWQLNNAWVTKISTTDLKSDGNEVAVESLEMVYEHLTVANGK